MRILLVEDEPSAAIMLAKGLREEAYAVDIATDGEAALAQAFVNDYDLIILARAAHPLSVMSTAAGVTLKKEHRAEEEYREALQIVAEQTRRLSRIVNDMFMLARADAGQYPLRKRTLYLNDLLEEVARAGAVLASNRRASVKLTNLPEAVFQGDEDLLRQMLLNLVDNAVKFTPSDGAVTLSLERRKDEYLLSVADAGPGIPAEAQHHIFERFYRADRARTRAEDGGAGLGLSIARWIARAPNGDIELDDSDSTGTKFIIRLPLANGK